MSQYGWDDPDNTRPGALGRWRAAVEEIEAEVRSALRLGRTEVVPPRGLPSASVARGGRWARAAIRDEEKARNQDAGAELEEPLTAARMPGDEGVVRDRNRRLSCHFRVTSRVVSCH
jgi:hypothetical protein